MGLIDALVQWESFGFERCESQTRCHSRPSRSLPPSLPPPLLPSLSPSYYHHRCHPHCHPYRRPHCHPHCYPHCHPHLSILTPQHTTQHAFTSGHPETRSGSLVSSTRITRSRLAEETKFWVTAMEVPGSMFMTQCHQPDGTKTTSPGEQMHCGESEGEGEGEGEREG